jgi:hypothetical protein
MKRLLFAFFIILPVSSLIAQDYLIKNKEFIMSEPFFSEQWVGDGKIAIITKNETTIVDLNQKVAYRIFHKKKFYVQAAWPEEMKKLAPTELGKEKPQTKKTVQVSPTGNTAIIAGKSCVEYRAVINSGSLTPSYRKICATTDLPLDLKKYAEGLQKILLKMQTSDWDDDAIKEFSKIEGLELLSEDINAGRVQSGTEVVEITAKSAPAGTYSVPEGYAKREKYSFRDIISR